ncbi:MAG TPA: TIR-like protein FxsC [Trebonia sp.]
MPDRGTPFFLSYARAGDGSAQPGTAKASDELAERLYYDLRENVGQLIALPTGSDYGFMDIGMRGGTDWPREIMRALGTCQVFVALLSVPYLSRDWCGREWYAFSQRSTMRLPGGRSSSHQGCIIPVRWAPLQAPLPPLISDDMFFAPASAPERDLPELYRQDGLFGLLRMGREDYYQIAVWQLAKLIAHVYHTLHLDHRSFAPEDLKNIFGEPSP